MNQERAVGLEHQEAYGLGEPGGQATCVKDLTASDEQAHSPRTVLSSSDRSGLGITGVSRARAATRQDLPNTAAHSRKSPDGKRIRASDARLLVDLPVRRRS